MSRRELLTPLWPSPSPTNNPTRPAGYSCRETREVESHVTNFIDIDLKGR
jgi:hypothetical protein